MISTDYCQLMARYNHWMNSRLYPICAELGDEELHADRGLFFKSIYLTLNHIMYGDRAFYARFTGGELPEQGIGDELYANFEELAAQRPIWDKTLYAWASNVDGAWLAESLTYTSKVDNKPRTAAHWLLVTHMFNHQTHHRGQVTTALSQLGVDMGSTDIPFMPADFTVAADA